MQHPPKTDLSGALLSDCVGAFIGTSLHSCGYQAWFPLDGGYVEQGVCRRATGSDGSPGEG